MSTYEELLKDLRWQEKRLSIIKRDGNSCKQCFNQYFVEGMVVGILIHRCKDFKDKYIGEVFEFNSPGGFPLMRIFEIKSYPLNECIVYFPPDANYIIAIRSMTPQEITMLDLPSSIDKSKYNWNNFLEFQEELFQIQEKEQRAYEKFELNFKEESWENYSWLHSKGLHVHHTYYQHGNLPWEYPDDALVALCYRCHEKLHENKTTPVRDIHGKVIGEYHNCGRCHGAGWFPEYHYVEGGICFRCRGARYEELIL